MNVDDLDFIDELDPDGVFEIDEEPTVPDRPPLPKPWVFDARSLYAGIWLGAATVGLAWVLAR